MLVPPSAPSVAESEPALGLVARIGLFIQLYWRTFLLFIAPAAASPLVIFNSTPDYQLIYVMTIMAFFWALSLLPLPVTGMLPLVLFPLLGIMDSDKTVAAYTREIIIMFVCMLIIAQGIQNSNLPRRLALGVVKCVGCSHYRLIYSLSLVTMFLSMWISNAATTSMMLPIIMAVLELLEENGIGKVYLELPGESDSQGESGEETLVPSNMTVCYFLMIAYSSSIGGMGTLVGTPTNAIFKGILESRFPKAPRIHFSTFMIFTFPSMLLIHFCTFLYMIYTFMGWLRPKSKAAKDIYLDSAGKDVMKRVIENQHVALGRMSFMEKCAIFIFVLVACLFFTREPGIFRGWGDVIAEPGYIRDSCSAVCMVFLIFSLPSNTECLTFFNFRKGIKHFPTMTTTGMLTWDIVSKRVYWELIFLMGSGFALAKAWKELGAFSLISGWLYFLDSQSPLVIMIILVVAIELLTEVTSNMALANIVLPIVAEMAVVTRTNPIKLMLPVVLACSFPFHTAAGTPANAMVVAYAHIPSKKIMVGGIGPTVCSAVVLVLSCMFYVPAVYPEFNSFPDWAND